ncbi:sigma 54-interacting transcriptional regulator [Planctomycetota bacterium]
MILHRVVTTGQESNLQELARQIGHEVFSADDVTEALNIVESVGPDLILFGSRFSPVDIQQFVKLLDKKTRLCVVVAAGDDSDEALRGEFIQAGADDYLNGSQDYYRLEQIAKRLKDDVALDKSHRKAAKFFADELSASVSMVGQSRATLEVLKNIKLVASSQCDPVLIIGETGTGKEMVAKAIHALKHPYEPFIAVNCAALTANLLESELFGHVRGSFTSADREKTGLFELAGAGTIFLDEISEMPMDLQAKLLRVLQEKTYRKVGGTKEMKCEATIIVSSNRDLDGEVQANRFRRDLYYRLNIFPIVLAPLRTAHRRKDIGLLAEYFLKTSTIAGQKAKKITSITKLAQEVLIEHDWLGNVRELQNVMERAIMLETTDKIGVSSIVIDPTKAGFSTNEPDEKVLDLSLAKAERELIARALQRTGWQKTRAAAMLGITRTTLYAKVKQHQIQKEANKSGAGQNELSTPVAPDFVTAT